MNNRPKKRVRYEEAGSDESELDEDYCPNNESRSIQRLRCTNKVAHNNFTTTKLEILKTEPKIVNILEEPLLQKDRARLLQLYEIYKTSAPSTEHWLELRNSVNKMFDECKNNYTQHCRYTTEQHQEMQEQLDILESYDPNIDLLYKILQLDTSINNKQTIYARYKELQNMSTHDDEKGKLRHWITWAISMPHDEIKTFPFSKTQLTNFLRKVSKTMDEELYGMQHVKEQILLFVSSKIQNPHMKRCSLGLIGAPGTGKCLGKDTPIIMYDGSTKMVQDIKYGDKIMGDDSTSRTILSTCTGKETLYQISQLYGDDYIVNESHILSLKLSKNPRIHNRTERSSFQVRWFDMEKSKSKSFKYSEENKNIVYNETVDFMNKLPKKGSIIDISLLEYLKRTKDWKTAYKGYKVGIEFEQRKVDLDPYLLGLWLGDGSRDGPRISTQDSVIIKYLHEILPTYNCYLQHTDKYDYRINGVKHVNNMLNLLRKYNVIKNKHIPRDYMINSRHVRLKILAGLIDSDGYMSNNCYEIVQKRKNLADDILFLTRSLGYRSVLRQVTNSCIYNGKKREGIYYKVSFGGHVNDIPVLITRKKAHIRNQIKDTLSYRIETKELGMGDYYGFTIDGNHRFVLGDFTVTHNTAISRLLAKVLDFPFEQISLGGITNPDYLKGHEYTYVGAQPGEISKCLKRMKYKNGILFLDEFDKISDNNDMCSALLHITDPIQNSEFRDKFLSEITIDLSYLWFIYSMNELPTDSALSDRIYTIEVPGYKLEDKKCIITDYLFPKALRNINTSESAIKISPKVAEYLIKENTDWENCVGVRSIEKVVNNIVSKIDFLVKHQDKKGKLKGFDVSFNTGKVIRYPVTLTCDMIKILC